MAAQITNRSPLTQALKSCYPALWTTFILSMRATVDPRA